MKHATKKMRVDLPARFEESVRGILAEGFGVHGLPAGRVTACQPIVGGPDPAVPTFPPPGRRKKAMR